MRTLTSAEAKRAIYIDFECLVTDPPRPALLGVLGPAAALEQLIIDPRLAPARVADRRRVVVAKTAIEELMAGASSTSRSRFASRPQHEKTLRARYRNAIQTARPWRQAILPTARITRDDDFAPKHTLDQLEATGGRYRPTTFQTKRDWHKLLEYNRHDCLALRHVALRAAAELESWRGFLTTRFCVDDDGRRVCFTAGSRSARLQALLERHHARRWAFLTAWNPAPRTLSREENYRRQRALIADLESRGDNFLPGVGRAANVLGRYESPRTILEKKPREHQKRATFLRFVRDHIASDAPYRLARRSRRRRAYTAAAP